MPRKVMTLNFLGGNGLFHLLDIPVPQGHGGIDAFFAIARIEGGEHFFNLGVDGGNEGGIALELAFGFGPVAQQVCLVLFVAHWHQVAVMREHGAKGDFSGEIGEGFFERHGEVAKNINELEKMPPLVI